MPSPRDRRSTDPAAAWDRASLAIRRHAATARVPYVLGAILLTGLLGYIAWTNVRHRTAVHDGSPSWSHDSRQIVYAREVDGQGDLFVKDIDGSGESDLGLTPSDEGSPAFSPGSREIAFDSNRDGNFEIYVMAASEPHTARRLTNNPSRDVSPAWSPDGRWIVFMSDRDSKPEFDIYRMAVDGTGVERLTTSGSNWFPQYSPDGKRLAFHVWRDVHVLDLATHALRRLTRDPADGTYPTWSPDGTEIAFVSGRNGRQEIFVMQADGSEPRVLVTLPSGGAIDPRWSPDGTKIAYVQVSDDGGGVLKSFGQQRAIYTVEVASGRVVRISR